MFTFKHQKPRRRLSVPYAPNAGPSKNPAKSVVAVAEVLGSKTVEDLVTHNLTTRGSRASRHAKHGQGPRESSAIR